MGILGKIFAVLVLLLSIAVAVLSWKLSDQRKLFRSHSEALAKGLLDVSRELGSLEDVPVEDELQQVSYTPAPDGGKEAGSLGFEQFKSNQQSVSAAVNALKAAIQKRHEQTQAFAQTLVAMGRHAGNRSVKADTLCSSADYQASLNQLKASAKTLFDRDQKVRERLDQVADALGVDKGELDPTRFNACAIAEGRFSIEKLFDDFAAAQAAQEKRLVAILSSMGDFRDKLTNYDNWTSELNADLARITSESDARRLNDQLKRFVADAAGIDQNLRDLRAAKRRLEEQSEQMKNTVNEVQAEQKRIEENMAKVSKENSLLKEENRQKGRMLNELKTAKQLNAEEPDPLQAPVITALKDVSKDVACDVRKVDKECNFVIVSGNNRQLCPGVLLIVINSKSQDKTPVKLKVKECNDYSSVAYVISGSISDVNEGDRVILSIDHADQVKQLDDEREAAAAAKRDSELRERERRQAESARRMEQEAKDKDKEDAFGLGL